jgi:aspartate-semialdehyde dehydrogenase
MVVALKPLHEISPIKRIHVATYQAASGAGAQAMAELMEQTRQVLNKEPVHIEKFKYQWRSPYPSDPDVFLDNGYTKEK